MKKKILESCEENSFIHFFKNGREEDSQEALTLCETKQAEDASFCSIPEFKNHWGCMDSKLLLA